MIKYILTLLILSSCIVANAQDKVYFEQLPVPSGVAPSQDPSIPKIAWNRWTTKNFTIHTIDFDQGEFLFQNIEQIKTWCLTRWGLPDIQFSTECRIFCAPTKEMMKKLFNIESSFGEARVDSDGKLIISYLWLVLDGRPSETIPPALTVVSLKEFNFKYRLNMGWWIYRGIATLNATIPQIKNYIAQGAKIDNMTASKIMVTTEADWKKLSVDQKRIFDAKAALLCLLIRKEHGQRKLLLFLKNSNYNDDVKQYLGFTDLAAFDGAYNRFIANLFNDIRQNKTPDEYLLIEPLTK